jgi:two-component system, sensor histidine kinase LadS
MPLGSFVFIFSQTLILSKNFATALRQIEDFTEELQKNNQQLAATINERTTALQQTNTQLSKNLGDIKSITDIFNKQKTQIQDQYKSIRSSITYAKNIQNNIFTDVETIYQRFPDSFLLFRPKDVISGDVYYFKELKGKIILAAIDCTENGVAGAFMSVISHKLLNDIIESQYTTEPAQILNSLHKGIRKLLRQEESNSGGGMDISLVVIDEGKKELKFAGAKSPLVYVTNGAMGMISGTNAHVGGLVGKEATPFSQTTVTLPTKGDFSFYLFTDGYQDQFGGEENKKMMKKNFLGLLHQIHRLQMQEQQLLLLEWYETWKGDLKQTDDILVMGVRL